MVVVGLIVGVYLFFYTGGVSAIQHQTSLVISAETEKRFNSFTDRYGKSYPTDEEKDEHLVTYAESLHANIEFNEAQRMKTLAL